MTEHDALIMLPPLAFHDWHGNVTRFLSDLLSQTIICMAIEQVRDVSRRSHEPSRTLSCSLQEASNYAVDHILLSQARHSDG